MTLAVFETAALSRTRPALRPAASRWGDRPVLNRVLAGHSRALCRLSYDHPGDEAAGNEEVGTGGRI